MVVSYNPGYQALVKDLKPSTRQRFVALEFGYPVAAVEAEIVERESGIEPGVARQLADIAARSRALKGHGLDEGISTRMLVQAARLMADGVPAHAACRVALVAAASDDGDVCGALQGLVDAHFA